MAKQSTVLKLQKTQTLNTTGILDLSDGVQVETEDIGVLNLHQLLGEFQGKLVKITVKETDEQEIDVI